MNEQQINAAVAVRPESRRWVSGRRFRVLLCASGMCFMIMLDSNIVAVSLPSIARDLGAAFSDIEWVVSAYVLTFAALLMPSGAVADRYGRRRTALVGLSVFTLSSLLCGLAPGALILNMARALQGIGAALQLSAALAILSHEFRGHDRARAFGFWGTVIGVAVALGPLVGGVITSSFGWRWAFLVNVPIGIVLVALAVSVVEESRDPDAIRLDLAGMVAGSAQFIVSRIISGDIAGALEHVAPAARAGLIEVSRGSFAAGFTTVLIVAGGIAALGALLTARLVSTVETAPARPPHAASRLPEVTE
jgi:MFS family permease